ncbi:hypothetical protein KI387_033104, partial [Taxus chinensis]
KVDCDYYTLRKTYVHPGQTAYIERLISDVISMNPVSLAIGDSGVMLVYLQLKPKLENKKYVENDFTLPRLPKGKHMVENMPAPQPTETIV